MLRVLENMNTYMPINLKAYMKKQFSQENKLRYQVKAKNKKQINTQETYVD